MDRSTRRIAVICAQNPDYNTGMCSVDLAARQFFSSSVTCSPSFLVFSDNKSIYSKSPEIEYESIFKAEDYPYGFDCIVFWGDFIFSHRYWETELIPRLLKMKKAVSREDATEILNKLLLLESFSEAFLKRVIIFGNTLLADDHVALANERYIRNLRRLMGSAKCVMMRDPISHYRSVWQNGLCSPVGCDAALLFAWARPERTPHAGGQKTLAIYFGRSEKRRLLQFFAATLAIRFKLRLSVRWVQWFPEKKEHIADKAKKIFVHEVSINPTSREIISDLVSADYVMSDVYHVCINAWAHGVPAICIGHGAKHEGSSLGSKKKEVFYASVYAAKYYVFWEELSMRRFRSTLYRVANMLNNNEATNLIFREIQYMSRSVHDRLVKEINEI